MHLKSALFLSAICVAVLGLGGGLRWNAVRAQVPKPDFENLAGYQRALESSTNPTAKVILQQIENGPADLARERAAAKSEGILLDANQLQRPVPPPGENAAPLYEKWTVLRRKIEFRPTWSGASLSSRYAYTPGQIAAVQKVLAAHPDVMVLLHQAADTPQCVFADEDWKDVATKGFPFSNTARFREAARELNTESYLLARQGRYSEAIADQARGFRVADQVASQPALLGYLTGVAIEQITLRGMEGILDMAGPNADVARDVQQVIAAHHSRLSLKHALLGEVAVTLAYTDLLRTTTPADLSAYALDDYDHFAQLSARDKAKRYSPSELRFLSEMIDAAEARYIHQMRQIIAVADASPAVRHPVFASLDAQKVSPFNPIDMLVGTHFSLSPSLDELENRQQAQEQTMMAGATVLEARGRTGAFPAALPGSFADPFNADQPLKYRREGKTGFVVYSVGPTGKFDGGKPGQSDWQPPTEVAFRYPSPPPDPVPPDMLK